MADPFTNGWSYIRFSETVRGGFRFAYPNEVAEFLRRLVETADARRKDIPENFPLWRAQLGSDKTERKIDESGLTIYVEEAVPYSADRMKPRRNAAHEGRVNPKGIPCLYLATDMITAMSEVRPWVGAKISLARFLTNKPLKLADLTVGHDFKLTPEHLFGQLPDDEMTKGIWAQIDKAFSTPVADDPSTAEYVPTQIVAEFLRRADYDGVIYKSHLGDGFNFALFDLECARVVDRTLREAKGVVYRFDDARP